MTAIDEPGAVADPSLDGPAVGVIVVAIVGNAAEHGGAVEAVPYMKAQMVESNRERLAKIERGEITVVGQNKFQESEDSPLTTGEDGGILTPDPEVERERIEALEKWRAERDQPLDGRGLVVDFEIQVHPGPVIADLLM